MAHKHLYMKGFEKGIRNCHKRVKIICLLFFALVSLNAQDDFRIGFQASPVFNWVSNNDDEILPTGGSMGMRLGAVAEVKLSEILSVTGGLNFAFHQGGSFRYTVGGNFLPNSELSDETLQTGIKPLGDNTKIGYSIQYLEVPLGLKVHFQTQRNFHFYGLAPMITIAASTRARGKITTDEMVYKDQNIVKDVNRRNLFLGLGGGIEYELGRSTSFFAGILYQKGMIDFTRNKGHFARKHENYPLPEYMEDIEDSFAALHNLTIQIGLLF